jgi:hypothetical protein
LKSRLRRLRALATNQTSFLNSIAVRIDVTAEPTLALAGLTDTYDRAEGGQPSDRLGKTNHDNSEIG